MDENALLQLLKDNAERGLQAIIETYGPAVHKICSSYLSGCRQEDIEEAESDVYVKLWKHRESIIINETYSLKSYLFAIARNTCIDRQRSVQPETLSLILTVSVFDFQVCRIRSVRHLNHIST